MKKLLKLVKKMRNEGSTKENTTTLFCSIIDSMCSEISNLNTIINQKKGVSKYKVSYSLKK